MKNIIFISFLSCFVLLNPLQSKQLEQSKQSKQIKEKCPYADKMADIIYKIEGGSKTKYPYGIKSINVSNESEARKVCINTINHNYNKWIVAGGDRNNINSFIIFLANVYCPMSCDAIGNKNWKNNMRKMLLTSNK
jgi:hypothetical protein